MSAEDAVVKVPKHLHSRLLYTNPVCLLTTTDPETNERNVMTISWVTALSNRSRFLASMNARRASAQLVQRTHRFTLNVPTAGMEELICAIGGCSGRDGDKFDKLDIATCLPGWGQVEDEQQQPKHLALLHTVAHLACRVDRVEEEDGHLVLFCTIEEAYVKAAYWQENKLFYPKPGDDENPPYLSFFGSKRFGVVQCPDCDES